MSRATLLFAIVVAATVAYLAGTFVASTLEALGRGMAR